MPKKKAAPKAAPPPKIIGKRRGWLICERCGLTVEHTEGRDGWPLHRCADPRNRISEIRPFTTWTDQDPKTPISTYPPSPLEGP